jgi:hypothetical protein
LDKEGPNGQELAPFAKIEEPETVLTAAAPLAPDEVSPTAYLSSWDF